MYFEGAFKFGCLPGGEQTVQWKCVVAWHWAGTAKIKLKTLEACPGVCVCVCDIFVDP